MELAGDDMRIDARVREVRVSTPRAGSAPFSGPALIEAPTPWLLGAMSETLLSSDNSLDAWSTGHFQWWRAAADGLQLAAARLQVSQSEPLEEQVAGLYDELLTNLDGSELCRIWNYVPAINAWRDGQENYRRFNQGRSRAFEVYARQTGSTSLPAASAVGATGSDLVVYALSSSSGFIEHFENPEQVPAYQYPAQYGPIPPSFARGSRLERGGIFHGFISGTAAIKGHRSLAKGDLAEQTRITLDNLRLMAERLGFHGALQGPAVPGLQRFFRVYLRHPAQAESALEILRRNSLDLADNEVTIVHADVCRAELDIEIEAKLVRDA